jgi:hypothetical protein
MSISSSITIQAPPSVVRKILLDFQSYPEWNPFITSLESPVPSPPPGTQIKFVARGFAFKPVVKENTPERFSWLSKVLAEWVFQGQHSFEFEPFGDMGGNGETVGCKFIQRENYRGALSFTLFLLRGKIEKTFNDMNKGVKARAEALSML